MNLLIRNINISDINKLKKFHCGKNAMDLFLSKEAYINHIFGEGTTQLVVDEDENEVIAYFTLKCDMMVIDDKEMYSEPRYIPCIEISRLAVQLKWQNGNKGIHLGEYLLGYIIEFIKTNFYDRVGFRFITLHAVLDRVDWYKKFEFVSGIREQSVCDNFDDTIYMYLDVADKSRIDEFLNATNKL